MAESGDLEFPFSGSGLDTSAADNGESDEDEDANDNEEDGGVSLKNQRPFTPNSCYLVDIVTDPLLDRQVRCILDLPPPALVLCVGAVCVCMHVCVYARMCGCCMCLYVLYVCMYYFSYPLCYVPCPPFLA